MRKLIAILVSLSLMYACTPVIEETGIDDKQKCEMHILTRSSATLNYPMALYAFDISTGKMVSKGISSFSSCSASASSMSKWIQSLMKGAFAAP